MSNAEGSAVVLAMGNEVSEQTDAPSASGMTVRSSEAGDITMQEEKEIRKLKDIQDQLENDTNTASSHTTSMQQRDSNLSYSTPSKLLQKQTDQVVAAAQAGLGFLDTLTTSSQLNVETEREIEEFERSTPSKLLQRMEDRAVSEQMGGVGSFDSFTAPSQLLIQNAKDEEKEDIIVRAEREVQECDGSSPSKILQRMEDRAVSEQMGGVRSFDSFTASSQFLIGNATDEEKEDIDYSTPSQLLRQMENRAVNEQMGGVGSFASFTAPSQLLMQNFKEEEQELDRSTTSRIVNGAQNKDATEEMALRDISSESLNALSQSLAQKCPFHCPTVLATAHVSQRVDYDNEMFDYTSASKLFKRSQDRALAEERGGVGSFLSFTSPSQLITSSSDPEVVHAMASLHAESSEISQQLLGSEEVEMDRFTPSELLRLKTDRKLAKRLACLHTSELEHEAVSCDSTPDMSAESLPGVCRDSPSLLTSQNAVEVAQEEDSLPPRMSSNDLTKESVSDIVVISHSELAELTASGGEILNEELSLPVTGTTLRSHMSCGNIITDLESNIKAHGNTCFSIFSDKPISKSKSEHSPIPSSSLDKDIKQKLHSPSSSDIILIPEPYFHQEIICECSLMTLGSSSLKNGHNHSEVQSSLTTSEEDTVIHVCTIEEIQMPPHYPSVEEIAFAASSHPSREEIYFPVGEKSSHTWANTTMKSLDGVIKRDNTQRTLQLADSKSLGQLSICQGNLKSNQSEYLERSLQKMEEELNKTKEKLRIMKSLNERETWILSTGKQELVKKMLQEQDKAEEEKQQVVSCNKKLTKDLQDQKTRGEKQCKFLERDISILRQEIQDLQQQKMVIEAYIGDDKKRVNELQKQLGIERSHYTELQKLHVHSLRAIDFLQDKNHKLLVDLQQYQTKYLKLQETYGVLQNQFSYLGDDSHIEADDAKAEVTFEFDEDSKEIMITMRIDRNIIQGGELKTTEEFDALTSDLTSFIETTLLRKLVAFMTQQRSLPDANIVSASRSSFGVDGEAKVFVGLDDTDETKVMIQAKLDAGFMPCIEDEEIQAVTEGLTKYIKENLLTAILNHIFPHSNREITSSSQRAQPMHSGRQIMSGTTDLEKNTIERLKHILSEEESKVNKINEIVATHGAKIIELQGALEEERKEKIKVCDRLGDSNIEKLRLEAKMGDKDAEYETLRKKLEDTRKEILKLEKEDGRLQQEDELKHLKGEVLDSNNAVTKLKSEIQKYDGQDDELKRVRECFKDAKAEIRKLSDEKNALSNGKTSEMDEFKAWLVDGRELEMQNSRRESDFQEKRIQRLTKQLAEAENEICRLKRDGGLVGSVITGSGTKPREILELEDALVNLMEEKCTIQAQMKNLIATNLSLKNHHDKMFEDIRLSQGSHDKQHIPLPQGPGQIDMTWQQYQSIMMEQQEMKSKLEQEEREKLEIKMKNKVLEGELETFYVELTNVRGCIQGLIIQLKEAVQKKSEAQQRAEVTEVKTELEMTSRLQTAERGWERILQQGKEEQKGLDERVKILEVRGYELYGDKERLVQELKKEKEKDEHLSAQMNKLQSKLASYKEDLKCFQAEAQKNMNALLSANTINEDLRDDRKRLKTKVANLYQEYIALKTEHETQTLLSHNEAKGHDSKLTNLQGALDTTTERLKSAKDHLRASEDKVKKQEELLLSLKMTVSKLVEQIAQQTDETVSLKGHLQLKEAGAHAITNSLINLERGKHQLECELTKTKADLKMCEDALKGTQAELEKERHAKRDIMESHIRTRKEVEIQKTMCENQNKLTTELEESLGASKYVNQKLMEEIERLHKDLENCHLSENKTQESLDTLTDQYHTLYESNSTLKAELKTEFQVKVYLYNELQEAKSAREELVRSLTDEKEAVEVRRKYLEEEQQEAEKLKIDLQEEVKALSISLTNEKDRLKATEDTIQDQSSQLLDKESQLTSLRKDLEKLQGTMAREVITLEKMNAGQEQLIIQMNERIEKLTNDKNNLHTRRDLLEDSEKFMKGKCIILELKLKKTEKDYDQKQEEFSKILRELDAASNQVAAATHELEELKVTSWSLEQALAQCKEELEMERANVSDLSQKLCSLDSTNLENLQKMSQLENILQAEQVNVETAKEVVIQKKHKWRIQRQLFSSKFKAQLEECQKEIQELQKANSRWEERAHVLGTDLAKKSKEVQEMMFQQQTTDQDLSEKNIEVSQIKGQLSLEKELLTNLNEKYNAQVMETHKLKSQLNRCLDEIEVSQGNNQELATSFREEFSSLKVLHKNVNERMDLLERKQEAVTNAPDEVKEIANRFGAGLSDVTQLCKEGWQRIDEIADDLHFVQNRFIKKSNLVEKSASLNSFSDRISRNSWNPRLPSSLPRTSDIKTSTPLRPMPPMFGRSSTSIDSMHPIFERPSTSFGPMYPMFEQPPTIHEHRAPIISQMSPITTRTRGRNYQPTNHSTGIAQSLDFETILPDTNDTANF